MNIIFFGTSEFAIPALHALIKHNLSPIVVVTSPDKPKNRGKQLTASPIKTWLQIDPHLAKLILQPTTIDAQFVSHIANLKPEVGIVVSYGKILPKAMIELFPKGVLNIHPSLLPKYRGPSPIQTVILNNDEKTGISIMLIDGKMDHGPTLARQEFLILKSKFSNKITYNELHDELSELGAQTLVEILPKWIDGKITPMPQDDGQATYTKLLKKEDGKIDWTKPAEEIERMIRAYNPWPGTYTILKDEKILKIKKGEVIIHQLSSIGAFFKTPDGFPAIVCGTKALKFLVVQLEGKKEMSGKAYLLGHPNLLE